MMAAEAFVVETHDYYNFAETVRPVQRERKMFVVGSEARATVCGEAEFLPERIYCKNQHYC